MSDTTTPAEPPEWAMREARAIEEQAATDHDAIECPFGWDADILHCLIARALVAARRDALEEALEIIFQARDKANRSLDWCNALNAAQDQVRALIDKEPA